MENKDTGILIQKENIIIQRKYFEEFLRLKGIRVLHRAPRPQANNRTVYGEFDSRYFEPTVTGCIFEEHPTQFSMKKVGWATSLSEGTSLIHVPYDLEGLQAGSLFIIPSGLDNAEGRVFVVLRLSNIAIYPASISCEIGPKMINTNPQSTITNFTETNFNLLGEAEDDE